MRQQARHAISMYTPACPGSETAKNMIKTDQRSEKDVWTTILSSKLGQEEKEAVRMADETFTLIAAGDETTARVICLALFYVLADKDSIMPRLMEELVSVMPEKTTKSKLRALERLPWLVSADF
jgi:cytochrome P450